MKTKLILSNGKEYVLEMSLNELITDYLHDDKGDLRNALVQFEEFTVNPHQIASLEELDESGSKQIGY